MKQEYSCFYA